MTSLLRWDLLEHSLSPRDPFYVEGCVLNGTWPGIHCFPIHHLTQRCMLCHSSVTRHWHTKVLAITLGGFECHFPRSSLCTKIKHDISYRSRIDSSHHDSQYHTYISFPHSSWRLYQLEYCSVNTHCPMSPTHSHILHVKIIVLCSVVNLAI